MMKRVLGIKNREPSCQTEECSHLQEEGSPYTAVQAKCLVERNRRRELMAEQAESRHDVQMTRGIGNPTKLLAKACKATGTFRAAGGDVQVLKLRGTVSPASNASSPC